MFCLLLGPDWDAVGAGVGDGDGAGADAGVEDGSLLMSPSWPCFPFLSLYYVAVGRPRRLVCQILRTLVSRPRSLVYQVLRTWTWSRSF